MHYTEGHWASQTLSLPNTFLLQVQMFGPDAGWAMGNDSSRSVVLHFQHGVWLSTIYAPTQAASPQAAPPLVYRVPLSPAPGGPRVGVSQAQFLSDAEGWAIGSDKSGLAVWQYRTGRRPQWATNRCRLVPVGPESALPRRAGGQLVHAHLHAQAVGSRPGAPASPGQRPPLP